MAFFPITVRNVGKHIVIYFPRPVDSTSNITVKAKKTSALTTKMKSVVVAYREKIT